MNFMKRREFLKNGATALALVALAPSALSADADLATTAKRPIRKAIMCGTVGFKGIVLEKMKAIKEAGFAGTEMMSHMD